jgi:uncharacterized OB-fold protein
VTYSTVYTPGESWISSKPYTLAIIKLDEGPMMTSQVICEPSEVKIGMRVRRVFRKIGQDGKRHDSLRYEVRAGQVVHQASENKY